MSVLFVTGLPTITVHASFTNLAPPGIATKKVPTQSPTSQLEELAKAVTVKVIRQDGVWGSGFIVQQQDSSYIVLTNEHVVKSRQPYTIEHHNGQKYQAQLLQVPNFNGNDLALLKFESAASYELASLKHSSSLKENEEVFMAGYPLDFKESDARGFSFRSGRITFLGMDRPLKGGYQLGTSHQIQKGMSGGPLLNSQGNVVGINGRHMPLWGPSCPYEYQDGSLACDALPEPRPLSWTIPIETFVFQASESLGISLPRPGELRIENWELETGIQLDNKQ
ncbi:MAG: trypsin-like peptidase domain-containing protein [Symploca sp. SIO1B1]|nr:trypsin-like peptidase domain-containing protein [Symploca sp. SIO1B1]